MEQHLKNHEITEGSITKQLMIFFFPILMGSFFQQMYNTVDTIIVGRIVGTTALASVGSAGPLLNMVNGFFLGLGSGATVILSQFFGASNREGVEKALHTGVALSLVLGVLVTVLGATFGPMVLAAMKTPENCLPIASSYVRIYFLGAVGSMVYNMGSGILRSMGDSRRPMIFLMISCGINIVMDILFVAVFRLGAQGAAMATALSQFISGGMLVCALLRLKDTPLRFSRLAIERDLLFRILRIGVPAGLQFVTFDLSNILIQSGINSFGDVTMAGWAAMGKMDALSWMTCGAFGMSVTTFVGQNFGAQKYSRIRRSVRTGLYISVPVMALISLTFAVFRETILGIFTEDPAVIAAGAYIVLMIVPYNAIFMPIEIFGSAMRGTGYSLVPTAITGSCICLFRVLWLVTVVSRWHTLTMLTVCYPLSWCLASLIFTFVYLRGNWLRKRIEACGMEPEVR